MNSVQKLQNSTANTGLAIIGLAIGATAIGALAIGALQWTARNSLGRVESKKLTIGELTVDELLDQRAGSQHVIGPNYQSASHPLNDFPQQIRLFNPTVAAAST